MADQQPAQVVALEREAGHHTEAGLCQAPCRSRGAIFPCRSRGAFFKTGLDTETLDTSLDLNPEHELHHPGEGGPDQGDELDERHLLRVLPGGELDAVTQVQQPLLLVLDLLKLEASLRGRVAGVAREVAVVHRAALLVLTLQEKKLDLMSEIVDLGDEAGLGAVRHLPAITRNTVRPELDFQFSKPRLIFFDQRGIGNRNVNPAIYVGIMLLTLNRGREYWM